MWRLSTMEQDKLSFEELELLRQALKTHMRAQLSYYGVKEPYTAPNELVPILLKEADEDVHDQFTADCQLVLEAAQEWERLNYKLIHLEQRLRFDR